MATALLFERLSQLNFNNDTSHMQLRSPWSSITIPVHKLVAVCAGERGWCVPVRVVTLVRVCAGAARGIGRAWRCRGCLGAGPLPAQFKPLGPIMASFGEAGDAQTNFREHPDFSWRLLKLRTAPLWMPGYGGVFRYREGL